MRLDKARYCRGGLWTRSHLHNKQILPLIDLGAAAVACNLRQELSKGGKLSCDYKRQGKNKTQYDHPLKDPEITNVSHTFVPVTWRLY
jgi:hypothetical protein